MPGSGSGSEAAPPSVAEEFAAAFTGLVTREKRVLVQGRGWLRENAPAVQVWVLQVLLWLNPT